MRSIKLNWTCLFLVLTALGPQVNAQTIVAENEDAFAIESVGGVIFPFVHRSYEQREVINHKFLIEQAKSRGCLALSHGPDYSGAQAAVRGFAEERDANSGRDFKRENGLYIRMYQGQINSRTHSVGTRIFVCHKTEMPVMSTHYFTNTIDMVRRFSLEQSSN